MYYVIAICILIVLLSYYIVYLLGKKNGRQEWIIKQNKLEAYNAKKDRKRFDKNMGSTIHDAINGLRQNSNASV